MLARTIYALYYRIFRDVFRLIIFLSYSRILLFFGGVFIILRSCFCGWNSFFYLAVLMYYNTTDDRIDFSSLPYTFS